jgi:hypothetical protein
MAHDAWLGRSKTSTKVGKKGRFYRQRPEVINDERMKDEG